MIITESDIGIIILPEDGLISSSNINPSNFCSPLRISPDEIALSSEQLTNITPSRLPSIADSLGLKKYGLLIS